MSYEQVASFTQITALLLFMAIFVGVVIYAFWPGNKKRFEEEGKIPLQKDSDQDGTTEHHG